MWTSAIALLFLFANMVGLLPAVLRVAPSVIGRQHNAASMVGFVGGILVYLAAAYCFLLAVSIVEIDDSRRKPGAGRYVAAGIAACVAATVSELALYVVVPGFSPSLGGLALLRDSQQLLGRAMWAVLNTGLSGGLALAVYVRLQSARRTREAFNAAELERVTATREMLASRLAAMQARIEPAFLLGTLAQVEALYERDPQAGDHMLDGLIAYLRAALPQLRTQRSMLQQELELVESYLRIVQIRMGSRLDYRIDVGSGLGECDFPPMALLPLIDDALRNGLEPLPHGGMITVIADTDGGRVRVRIMDDGLPRPTIAKDGFLMATLQERLSGLYGSAARIELSENTPQGVIAAIEVPLDTTRPDR
jgi:hypothetical protein